MNKKQLIFLGLVGLICVFLVGCTNVGTNNSDTVQNLTARVSNLEKDLATERLARGYADYYMWVGEQLANKSTAMSLINLDCIEKKNMNPDYLPVPPQKAELYSNDSLQVDYMKNGMIGHDGVLISNRDGEIHCQCFINAQLVENCTNFIGLLNNNTNAN